MKPDSGDGLPLVTHASSKGLGVRANVDIPVDEEGVVEPGSGGLSVSPDSPANLPYGRRPPTHGGIGRFPVWELETDALPDTLVCAPETSIHAFIEPAYSMELGDYQEAIEGTRALWRECR
jgi:hypothetical protein